MYTNIQSGESADCDRRVPTHVPDAGSAADELVNRARAGDVLARQRLYARCLPALLRWTRSRLSGHARDVNDADDLVQIALLRALRRLDTFSAGGYEGFLAYLRQILLNEIRGELRKQRRRGENIAYDDDMAQDGDPVVECMLRHERERAYAGAIAKLNRRQQDHIAMRVQFGMSFDEIASQVGGSADGARMTVARALRSLSASLSNMAA